MDGAALRQGAAPLETKEPELSENTDLSTRHLVSTEWLENNLDRDGLRIFDATVVFEMDTWEANDGRAGFEESHVPGARFIDLIGELSDTAADAALPDGVRAYKLPGEAQFAAAISAHGVENGTDVVVYDNAGGMWAARLWWLLRVFGHDRVAVLDGGWAKWEREQRPAASGAPDPVDPGRFEAGLRRDLLATTEQVEEISRKGGSCLINALTPELYTGEAKAALRRPGRIPGSHNVPVYAVYAEDGTLLPPDRLRELFAEALAGNPERVVTYCGGGIAASSDALALATIGVDAAVYDGSLVEWTADENLPLVTG